MMQTWLGDRGQIVPDATSTRHRMTMNGVEQARQVFGEGQTVVVLGAGSGVG